MKSCPRWFNIYLLLLLLVSGCATTSAPKKKEDKPSKEDKKAESAIRLHLETVPDGSDRSGTVMVTRQKIPINIEREPFLTEGDLLSASIIDTVGGFDLQLFFDMHGTFYLDMVTTSNKGRRIAVLAQYPLPKGSKDKQFSRWIGAPLIARRIANGVVTFSPDLSREEAQRLVLGLNNVAKKAKKVPIL